MKQLKVLAPLQSWDLFSEYLATKAIESRKSIDCSQVEDFKSRFHWDFDPSMLLKEDYTTLVVTDKSQTIQWVNNGFTKMTGYPKKYAIGKHPRFLQGIDTSTITKTAIKKELSLHQTVSKQLLNYKKDGTPYLCDIKIIPLFNSDKEVTHFMALEKKARVA